MEWFELGWNRPEDRDEDLRYIDLMPISETEKARLRESGTQAEVQAIIRGDSAITPKTEVKVAEPETKVEPTDDEVIQKVEEKYPLPQGMVTTQDPRGEFYDEVEKEMDKRREEYESRTHDTPTYPEDVQAKLDEVEMNLKQLPQTDTTDLGERVGPFYDWLSTPSAPDTWGSYFNALRPQRLATIEQQKAYEQAKEEGKVSPWMDTLYDAMTRETESHVVESGPAWVARLLNVPSALAATGLDWVGSSIVGAEPISLSDRVAKGEGLADVSREAATGLTYGERYPDPDVVGDEYTIPERAAYVAGFIGDLALPFDLFVGDAARAVKGLKEAAGASETSLAKLAKASVSREPNAVLKTIAEDPANLEIADAWKRWALSEGDAPAPSVGKLDLPTESKEAARLRFRQILDRLPTEDVKVEPKVTARIVEDAVASKLARIPPSAEVRVGDVLVPAADMPRVEAAIRKSEMGRFARMTYAEAEGEAIRAPLNLRKADLLETINQLGAFERLPAHLQDLLREQGNIITIQIEDWNSLATAMAEGAALKATPFAVDLRKVSDINPARLTPAEIRSNILNEAINGRKEIHPRLSPAASEALQEAESKVGSVGQSIMEDIRKAKAVSATPEEAFSRVVYDAYQDRPHIAMQEILRATYGDAVAEVAGKLLTTHGTKLNQALRVLQKAPPQEIADRLARFVATTQAIPFGALTDPADLAKAQVAASQRLTALLETKAIAQAASNPMIPVIRALVLTRQIPVAIDAGKAVIGKMLPSIRGSGREVRDIISRMHNTLSTVAHEAGITGVDDQLAEWLVGAVSSSVLHDDAKTSGLLLQQLEDILTKSGATEDQVKQILTDLFDDTMAQHELTTGMSRILEIYDVDVKIPDEKLAVILSDRITEFLDQPMGMSPLATEMRKALATQLTDLHPVTADEIAMAMTRLTDRVEDASKIYEQLGGVTLTAPMTDEIRKIFGDTPDILDVIGQLDVKVQRQLLSVTDSLLPTSAMTGAKRLWRRISGAGRQGMLAGFVLPNLAYHMVNALSAPLIMTSTLGLKPAIQATLQTMGDVTADAAHALLTKSVSCMLGAESADKVIKYIYKVAPSSLVRKSDIIIELADGRIYTTQAVAKLAIDNGLLQGQQQVEFASDLVDDLIRLSGRNVKGGDVGAMRDFLRNNLDPATETIWSRIANLTDFRYRLSVLTTALHEGKSEQEALDLARASLFNYNTLTEFEKKNLSSWWWFYSFSRHNLLTTLRTITTHPKRAKQLVQIMQVTPKAFDQKRDKTTSAMSDLGYWSTPLFGSFYQSRIRMGQLKPAANSVQQRVVQLYGPPIPMVDAFVMLDAVAQSIGNTAEDPSLDNTLGEVARTALGHMSPLAATLVESGVGGVAPIAIGFGDVRFKGKHVDDRIAVSLQSIGMWDAVAEAFRIRTIRPTDRDWPKDRLPNQIRGNEYYVIDDSKSRVAFNLWFSRLTQTVGMERAIRDTYAPLAIAYMLRQDPSYGTFSQSLSPNLDVSREVQDFIALGNYTGAIELETSRSTVQEQIVEGPTDVESDSFRQAIYDMK